MTHAHDTTRDRLASSILLAVLIHALAFVALELFLKFAPQRPPEYRGPLFVQLEEQPVVQQARQPALAAAEVAPVPSAAASAVSSAPQQPAGPPLRTAAEAATAQASPAAGPKGSPFRMEGKPVQEGKPLPAGQGFQTPSTEPSLPPAGTASAGAVSPQGTPLRAVAPSSGEGAAAPSVPLEAVDRALAAGGTAQAGGGTTPARVAAGAPGSAGTQPGAGQGDTAREGISIEWEDATRGREPTYTPRPVIPKWVSDAGLRLTVGIAFVLTPQGVLHSVRVEKSSGYSDVDSSVLDAVRRWKFRPGGQKDVIVNGRVGYLILPR